VAQETVKARQLVVDQVTALAQSKLKSTLDVSFANVNLSEAKLLLASAENDVQAASAALSTALGYPDQRVFTLSEEPMAGPILDPPETLVQTALRSRPELAGARLEQGAEQRFAKAERALSYPTVSTVATAGYIPSRLPDQLVQNHYSAVGLNVSIPILNGGLFTARRTEAELRAKAAGQNIRDLENRISRDVRVAYLDAVTAYERVGLTAQMLDQARLALDDELGVPPSTGADDREAAGHVLHDGVGAALLV
jgi:outer membrane protein